VENEYPVLVLDGSSSAAKALNRPVVRECASATHLEYPAELHLGLRIASGLAHVNTEYVVICPDDDFVVPESVSRCADFLSGHPGYSAAMGRIVALAYSSRIPILKRGFRLIDVLSLDYNLGHRSFVRRILHLVALTFSGCPPLFYSVRRTKQAIEAFSLVKGDMKYSSMELLVNSMTLLQGKAGVLPVFFGLRDYSSETTRDPIRDDPMHYFTRQDLEYIRSLIVPMMQQRESLPSEVARHAASLLLDQYYAEDNPGELQPDRPAPNFAEKLGWVREMLISIFLPGLLAKRLRINRRVIVSLRRALQSHHRAQ